jgi:CRISPR type III-B/RAMP module RAMP protein Cmr1
LPPSTRPPPWEEIKLALVTPAVLGGARPREVDPHHPLRVPSVRGCLRHWFRFGVAAQLHVGGEDAAAGGGPTRLSDAAVRLLRLLEGELFGEVFGAGDQPTRASRLVIRPVSDPLEVRALNAPAQGSGLGYLGYGLFQRDQQTTALMPGQFTLKLRVDRAPLEDEAAYQRLRGAVAATIALWATCGGLGSRTRRGWGSLELLSLGALPWDGQSKNIPTPPLGKAALSPKERLGWMMDTLDLAGLLLRRYVDNHPAVRVSENAQALDEARKTDKAAPRRPHTQLRTLTGVSSVRLVAGGGSSARDALEGAGQRFMSFRSTLARSRVGGAPHDDYFEVKGSLVPPAKAPRFVKRAAFGLPLPFYFRSLNGAKVVINLADSKHGDRMASPLLFRPVQVGPSRWRVALIYLCEGTIPRAPRHLTAGFALRAGRQRDTIPEPDDQLILDFLDMAVRE